MKIFLPLLAFFATFQFAAAKVVTKDVSYESGGVTMKGLLAWDDATDAKRPGVLVVHEWWGYNDYARKRAEMLAELGYVALAVDMYGDGKNAAHPKDAGAFAGAVMKDLPVAKARFEAARALLNAQKQTDASKNGAIGYCFGGGVVLHMARMGLDLDGVVSFHGSLGAKMKAEKGAVKAKVLVCNGAADKFIGAETVKAFKEEMKEAGADMKFKNYKDALHGFTNPDATENGKKFDIPIAYQEAADKASWKDMQKFFNKVFKD
jgi:dienelactone hydrolase